MMIILLINVQFDSLGLRFFKVKQTDEQLHYYYTKIIENKKEIY